MTTLRRRLRICFALFAASASFAAAQETATWLRQFSKTSASSVTADRRFAEDIHRYLAPGPAGSDLAATAASYMTLESGNDVHMRGRAVYVDACAVHSGECALLWADSGASQGSKLALCFLAKDLQIYVSSRSDATLSPELTKTLARWQRGLEANGIFLRPAKAYVITEDGNSHSVDVKTLLAVASKGNE